MPEAMYVRIASDLRDKIKSGKLKSGNQLPAEQGLQEEYGRLFQLSGPVSRNTVRDAIEMLVREGRVEKRPGQGTFILQKEEPFLTTLSGEDPGAGETATYLKTVARQGSQAENTPPRVEIHSSSKAPELQLDDNEQVISRHQQRFIDGKPYSLQTSFYALKHAQNAPLLLTAGNIKQGAVAYIEEELGIKQAGWREELHVRVATSPEKDFFDFSTKSGAQVIEAFRTAFDAEGNPIRLTITVYAADRNRLAYEAGTVPEGAVSAAAVSDLT